MGLLCLATAEEDPVPRDLRELTRTRQFCESLGGPLETTGNPWRQGASASGVVVSQLRLVDSLLSSVSVSPLPARGGGFGCCFPVSSCAALSVPANPPWFDDCMMTCSAVQCEFCLLATSCASCENLFFRRPAVGQASASVSTSFETSANF